MADQVGGYFILGRQNEYVKSEAGASEAEAATTTTLLNPIYTNTTRNKKDTTKDSNKIKSWLCGLCVCACGMEIKFNFRF